jgi:hypothetical protein
MLVEIRNHGCPRRSGYRRAPLGFYVEPRSTVHQLFDVEPFIGAIIDPCCGVGTTTARARGTAVTQRKHSPKHDFWHPRIVPQC